MDLIAENDRLVMLIIDERSMVNAGDLGLLTEYMEQTAHNGKNDNIKGGWGGIPIVLFLGDDGQLPSINAGAFDSLKLQYATEVEVLKGLHTFKEMGHQVRTLKTSMRQDENEEGSYLEMLNEAYVGSVSDVNATKMMDLLHLQSDRFTEEQRDIIREKSIHVFANKEPMEFHNQKCLYRDTNQTNPVAKIKSNDTCKKGHRENLNRSSGLPQICMLARGSLVCITGCNLRPEWQLFNNATGKVLDIVYEENKNPNGHDLPKYILVEFPGYTGPPFIQSNPKAVPIAPIRKSCEKGCCSRLQIPLRLGYGQTIHTFQGITVGPNTDKRKYAIPSIIIYPGCLTFEGKNPGLFYSAFSRGTTIGNEHDPLSSAIYFDGKSMSKERVKDMIHRTDNTKYLRVLKRDNWIQYLQNHDNNISFSDEQQNELGNWINTTQFNEHILDDIIKHYNTLNMARFI
jgi:hypothetical protein